MIFVDTNVIMYAVGREHVVVSFLPETAAATLQRQLATNAAAS